MCDENVVKEYTEEEFERDMKQMIASDTRCFDDAIREFVGGTEEFVVKFVKHEDMCTVIVLAIANELSGITVAYADHRWEDTARHMATLTELMSCI
jgi:hypothetical protein